MIFKSLLFSLTTLVSLASFASADSITIGSQDFKPENLVGGEWLGEPVVGSIQDYGITELSFVVAFFHEADFKEIIFNTVNFETEQDIHAVHIHGKGSGNQLMEVHGYTVIYGDEAAEKYQMETYNKAGSGFDIVNEFSSSVRGALDCGSAAKLAILHGPAFEPLISLTLGKTEYIGDPKSEEKFASDLTKATALLALERSKSDLTEINSR